MIVHRILKSVLSRNPHPVSAKSAETRMGQPEIESSHLSRNRGEVGLPTSGEKTSPWSKRRRDGDTRAGVPGPHELSGPISSEELHEIAEESSQAERRADEAERELMEWKKVKFMQDRVGEDFDGLIISVTKFGFFVELTDLFVEGLVPLSTLTDDHYTYHENTREIIGQQSHKTYRLGQKIRVLVDRIDPVEKKIQFAVVEEKPAPVRGKRRVRK